MSDRRQRLLVVDDNEDNRDLLRRMLERRGYEVTLAEDGPAALARLAAEPFDLVLLDVMMPGMSGIEVLEQLRPKHSKAALPVLMTTALSDSADVVAALRAGANDYVTKPIDFAVAYARIDSLLELRAELAPRPAGPIVGLDGSLALGTVLDGRYRVESILGEGGFAVVFAATQLSTGQRVALKLLRAHRVATDEGSVERRRFEREMGLIGRLRHPHIVRLIDSGKVEVSREGAAIAPEERVSSIPPTRDTSAPWQRPQGPVRIPYLVMEFLDGQPLSSLLAERAPLSVEEAIDLLLPVASAVGMAHRAGVVHRDLKPPNIMIVAGPGGALEPKVLDFGIAKPSGEAEVGITCDAGLVGTPEYMSPEQTKGEEVGVSADQYALGVILYESLTGRRPFEGQSLFELLHRITKGEYTQLCAHRPELPPELAAIISRAMDVDPSARFASLEAFFLALLPFASPAAAARWRGPLERAGAPPAAPLAPPPASVPAAPSALDEQATESPLGRLSAEPTQSFAPPPPSAPSPSLPRLALAMAAMAALAIALYFARVAWQDPEPTSAPSEAEVVNTLPGPGMPESARTPSVPPP